MEKAIITVEKELDPIKWKNLFLSVLAINFMWMLFHFTVVFFFTLQLQSIALVWIFLWIWNFFAFLFDIPAWIIQNYFKPKTLYRFASISQLIAMLIFWNFIFQVSWLIKENIALNWLWVIWDVIWLFLWNWLNIVLLIIASLCYWLTRELQDVTTISYVLNNSNPDQYASILAKNNIAMWLWSLLWLITSWVILTLNPKLIIIIIILILIMIVFFTAKFFDNWEKTLNLKDIYKFKVLFEKNKLEDLKDNLKENVLKTVNSIELKEIIKSENYLFLKPNVLKKWLSLWIMVEETKNTFITTYKVLSSTQSSLIIYWSITILLTFWFRDTFAATFLIQFLDSLWKWWSYILLWIIAVPAFWLQWFFWKLAKRYWKYTIANIWLFLSWVSLFLMWFFTESKFILISLALINSIWFASCMSLSQAAFLESYNESYANFNNLKEIDANASAAPIKILQNLANVFGLFFWWIILWLLNYLWFFITFWLFMIWILYWSIKRKKDITKPKSN